MGVFSSFLFSLSRWPTTFKQKIIQQCKALPSTSDLEELIHCAEATLDEEEIDDTLALGSVFSPPPLFYFLIFFGTAVIQNNDVFKL